jgi:hypothetical protein
MVDLYAYYRDLALDRPDTFLWASLGHMAGAEIVGAMVGEPAVGVMATDLLDVHVTLLP